MTKITKFVWNPVDDCIISELDGTGAVQAVYTNEPQQYGGVISQRRGTTTSTYHTDALGSTRFLTDSSGNVTDTYLNDAWGNDVAATGTTVNPFKWVGKCGYYTDTSTAQVYVRARMYQPTVGRWCSVDPIGLADGANQYIYTTNNPFLIDPTGQITVTPLNEIKNGTCVRGTPMYIIRWGIQLDKPAPCDGYIVQSIIRSNWEESCFLKQCHCSRPAKSTFSEAFLEAFPIKKYATSPNRPGNPDTSVIDTWQDINDWGGSGQCGEREVRGQVKFFCKTTTGDLEKAWDWQYGLPTIHNVEEFPKWWWNAVPIEAECDGGRFLKKSYNCCHCACDDIYSIQPQNNLVVKSCRKALSISAESSP